MKEDSLDRVRDDLATMNAALGRTLPYGAADVWFYAALAIASGAFAVSHALGAHREQRLGARGELERIGGPGIGSQRALLEAGSSVGRGGEEHPAVDLFAADLFRDGVADEQIGSQREEPVVMTFFAGKERRPCVPAHLPLPYFVHSVIDRDINGYMSDIRTGLIVLCIPLD